MSCKKKRTRGYFDELKTRSPEHRGAYELIEDLALLGAPASLVAAYLDTTAETIIDWHDHNARLPVIIWDSLLDMAIKMIEEGERRDAWRVLLPDCDCQACRERRLGGQQGSLMDIFAEIAGVDVKYLESMAKEGNS